MPTSPTILTLCEQMGRWYASCSARVNADTTAAPYTGAGALGLAGFPRGMLVREPAAVGVVGGGASYPARGAVWVRPGGMPEKRWRTEAADGVCVSFTPDQSPPPEAGQLGAAARTFVVRVMVEAATEQAAIAALADVQRAFSVGAVGGSGGGSGGGGGGAGMRGFSYAPKVSATVSGAGSGLGRLHGMIGVPPPGSIAPVGVNLWRVLSVSEVSPPQNLSVEIDAASTMNGVSGAPGASSGMVVAAMSVAALVVPALVAPPVKACAVSIGVAAGSDVALRVVPGASDWGVVALQSGSFTSGGGVHAYADVGFGADVTLNAAAASLATLGFTVSGLSGPNGARLWRDVMPMPWESAASGGGGGGLGSALWLWGTDVSVEDTGGMGGGA